MQMMKRMLALLCCVLLLCPAALAEDAQPPVMEVHQMVLGYADGYYIRCGDVEIMIDGGNPLPGSRNDDVVNCLRAVGVDTLDMHIITHWHLDHCEKMNVVLEEFGDENTVVYGVSAKLPDTAEGEGVVVQMAPLANGSYQQMKMGDVIEIGGMTITCIGPRKLSQGGRCNADSLNFVVQYGTRRILFTGDYAQSGCINVEFADLCKDVDVLKFPHHAQTPFEIGNKASRNASPEYVLVPSQINNYSVWQFFSNLGVGVERDKVLTNRAGHVVVLTDGDFLEVRTEQDPADYAPEAK